MSWFFGKSWRRYGTDAIEMKLFISALLLFAALAIVGVAAAGISRGFFGWP